jgi:hypothetical protein
VVPLKSILGVKFVPLILKVLIHPCFDEANIQRISGLQIKKQQREVKIGRKH